MGIADIVADMVADGKMAAKFDSYYLLMEDRYYLVHRVGNDAAVEERQYPDVWSTFIYGGDGGIDITAGIIPGTEFIKDIMDRCEFTRYRQEIDLDGFSTHVYEHLTVKNLRELQEFQANQALYNAYLGDTVKAFGRHGRYILLGDGFYNSIVWDGNGAELEDINERYSSLRELLGQKEFAGLIPVTDKVLAALELMGFDTFMLDIDIPKRPIICHR
jgi:hypothetical protein